MYTYCYMHIFLFYLTVSGGQLCWVNYSWLVVLFCFFLLALWIYYATFLACRVFSAKPTSGIIGVPFWREICFLLIFKFFLILGSFVIMWPRVNCFGLKLWGELLSSWTWMSRFLPRFGMFSAIIYLTRFSASFSLSFPYGTPEVKSVRVLWQLCWLLVSLVAKVAGFLCRAGYWKVWLPPLCGSHLFLLMVFHKSSRLSWFPFILFRSSEWITSDDLPS